MSCRVWLRQLDAERQIEDPWFWFESGGSAFGNWLGALTFDSRARRELGSRFKAFGAVQSLWQPAGESWIDVDALASAAHDLIESLEQRTASTSRIVALYAVCAASVDPRLELLADLHDVVRMAEWARARGSRLVAFRVECPDRNAPSDLSVEEVYALAAEILGPTLEELGLRRVRAPWMVYRGRAPGALNLITDAYANRLILWNDGGTPDSTSAREGYGPAPRVVHRGHTGLRPRRQKL